MAKRQEFNITKMNIHLKNKSTRFERVERMFHFIGLKLSNDGFSNLLGRVPFSKSVVF